MNGLLAWVVPFVSAIPFIGSDKQLLVPKELFKSIMVVVSIASGSWLLLRSFAQRSSQAGKRKLTAMSGLTLGMMWMVMHWVLDVLILLPLNGMSSTEYAMDIGLRYLCVPIIGYALGYAANMSKAVADRRG